MVTPVLGSQSGLSRGALVVGSVLGGGMAAALYAAGQSGRFSRWLIAVEFVALLSAPRTLHMLRMARIPGRGAGRGDADPHRYRADHPLGHHSRPAAARVSAPWYTPSDMIPLE